MAMDSVTVIAQNIINRYKLRNPNNYDAGEEAINRLFLEDLLTELVDVQMRSKAQVAPGSFLDGESAAVTGLGGPLL